ncbi:unnamed protein product, partial [Meganyctiphanes norvegica]
MPEGVTSDYCLLMWVGGDVWSRYSGRPYMTAFCSSSHYTLCEDIMVGVLMTVMLTLICVAYVLRCRGSKTHIENNENEVIENYISEHGSENGSNQCLDVEVNYSNIQCESSYASNPMENNITDGSTIEPPNYVTETIVDSDFTPEEEPPRDHVILLLGMDREITEVDMGIISDHLGLKWRELGRKMGFSAGQIENIHADFPRSKDRAYELMCIWHDRETKAATVANITTLLLEVKAYSATPHHDPP